MAPSPGRRAGSEKREEQVPPRAPKKPLDMSESEYLKGFFLLKKRDLKRMNDHVEVAKRQVQYGRSNRKFDLVNGPVSGATSGKREAGGTSSP